jgi:peptidoglycan hydrolase CwlO-like protein
MRNDAQRRIQEYQREIGTVEQDLTNCEKKIAKLKEKHEKSLK